MDDKAFLSLSMLKELVEKRFGKDNNFRLLNVPVNLAMPEAFIEKNQMDKSLLGQADALNMNVFSVSPFLSGLLLQVPISTRFAKANYLPPKHLNLIRSLPYKSIKSVIFGAKKNRHLKINLTLPYMERMTKDDIEGLFYSSSTRKQEKETHLVDAPGLPYN